MLLKLSLFLPLLVCSMGSSQTQSGGAASLFSSLPPAKPGLWEDKTTSADGSTDTFRTCRKGDHQSALAAMSRLFANCTFSNQTHTSTSLSFDMSCKMQSVSTSGHFAASQPTPEEAHSVMKMTMIVQGKPMPMDSTTDSRFISSDCGSLQPGTMQKVQ
jgi:Protein of unknown function (DUF3617)